MAAGEPGFPARLASIPWPAESLWLRGADPPTAATGVGLGVGVAVVVAVAVVGTRRPDAEGRRLAAGIAEEVSRRAAVVSGLAAGIDRAAHRAAVGAGAPNWAVVGSGVDVARCPEDPGLVDDILAAGGGLLSEYEPGAKATPASLVARDRLQSGLSEAVVVVQTDLASGTMHTTRFA
ncbi:MAG TPA: DNA-processing protein DprA, partial [Acidimicrobiales bacterium]|nr:DNA-processing protein DprA [Acidimicrobiales bacterium]